jgi:hypothetical protein
LVFGITWITLLVFLTAKEIAGIINSEYTLKVGSSLTKIIIPLLVLFILVVVLSVARILEIDFLESILYP